MAPPFRIEPGLRPTMAGDPATFIRAAFEGVPLAPMISERLDALGSDDGDPARLLELGVLFQLVGEKDRALLCQQTALASCAVYRHAGSSPPSLRLLAFCIAGDLMANMPFELMIEGRGMEVTKVYLSADQPWPADIPDHDLVIMAIGESDEARPLLKALAAIETRLPRPIINRSSRVLELARDRLFERLAGSPGVVSPPTLRLRRKALVKAAGNTAAGVEILPGDYPIIIRPVGSHAGRALDRIDSSAAMEAYLAGEPAELFYVSPFVDYAGADGLYRKYRIVFFGGRPFVCHMAVSEHWMVHYLNAGMAESDAKRTEERIAMETFDDDFARRHAANFAWLSSRLELDYFAIDCAELQDGSLLIFEADVAMIIHDFDPPALYPYKKRQMRKVFDAMESFLHSVNNDREHAGGPPG